MLLVMVISMIRVAHLFLGLFCLLQIFIGFNIPLGIATILFVGSGLGGLFALWRAYYDK